MLYHAPVGGIMLRIKPINSDNVKKFHLSKSRQFGSTDKLRYHNFYDISRDLIQHFLHWIVLLADFSKTQWQLTHSSTSQLFLTHHGTAVTMANTMNMSHSIHCVAVVNKCYCVVELQEQLAVGGFNMSSEWMLHVDQSASCQTTAKQSVSKAARRRERRSKWSG